MNMKLNETNEKRGNVAVAGGLKQVCLTSCRQVLARVARAKAAIFAEAYQALKSQEHLLRLALNEAEAAAWQTMFPHLVFPTLAMEKVQAVATWDARQRAIRRNSTSFRLAA
jgi:hypothetical protein